MYRKSWGSSSNYKLFNNVSNRKCFFFLPLTGSFVGDEKCPKSFFQWIIVSIMFNMNSEEKYIRTQWTCLAYHSTLKGLTDYYAHFLLSLDQNMSIIRLNHTHAANLGWWSSLVIFLTWIMASKILGNVSMTDTNLQVLSFRPFFCTSQKRAEKTLRSCNSSSVWYLCW